MSDSITRFLGMLIERFPAIQPIYDEHLEDNNGELLPHLLCGDLTRWAILLYSQSDCDTNARELLTAFLHFLENAFRESDDNVRELISVSILENFPSSGEDNYGIRDLLGPELFEELQKVNW
jgi:hypothetical protein